MLHSHILHHNYLSLLLISNSFSLQCECIYDRAVSSYPHSNVYGAENEVQISAIVLLEINFLRHLPNQSNKMCVVVFKNINWSLKRLSNHY